MTPFRGSLVALITPFTSAGKIDSKTLADLVEWHITQGTDGIVCCGATGESCALTGPERLRVARICVEAAAGRIPVVVGTGTANTQESVKLTAKAQALGVDGCLIVTPYYNKPTQRGCVAHFREVASVGLPVIVYHNPPRAVVRLTLDTMREIAGIPGVVALKDSSGDIAFVEAICKTTSLSVLSGDDDLTYASILKGAVGAISVIGNVLPRGWKQMIQAALQRAPQAERLNRRYLPLAKAHFLETNPQCVKYVLAQMGRCQPALRLPLVWPTQETQDALRRILLSLALPMFSTLDRSKMS